MLWNNIKYLKDWFLGRLSFSQFSGSQCMKAGFALDLTFIQLVTPRKLEKRVYGLFSYIFMFPCSCKHVFFFSKSLNRPLNYYNLRQKPPHLVIVIYINLNSLIHSCNLFIWETLWGISNISKSIQKLTLSLIIS